MNCLTYQLQTMMPSLLGDPSDDDVRQCSAYGWIENSGDLRFCSQFEADCSNSYYDANWNADWSLGADSHGIAGRMMGQHDIHLRQPTQDELNNMHIMGLSFLPWNKTDWVRVQTTGDVVIPVNPLHKEVLVENAMTVAKLAGIGLVSFYAGRFAVRKLANRL